MGGMPLLLMVRRRGRPSHVSPAALVLASETQGLSLSFTDSHFLTSTSHYGSARVKDTGTPGNNYNSHPFGLLTYATPSKKWVRGPSGLWVLSDFANDLPYEWDESANLLGIRIEEQRSSLAFRSRRLDDATHWTASNISTSAVQGSDGVLGSATRITATANNGTILGSINSSASAARRFAPFIRRVAGTGNLEYTLDGGSTWTAFTGITSSFLRKGGGATVANPRLGFRIVSSGDEFDIDFANGETGAFDTSPLESTDSHVTRAADNISLATSRFPYSATVGTLMVEFAALAAAVNANGGFDMHLITDDNERLSLRHNQFTAVSGVAQCSLTPSGWAVSTSFSKRAGAYAANDFAACIDGGTVATDTSGSVPNAADALRLTVNNNTISPNSHVKSLTYFPRRMTNTELQEITS